MQRATCNFVVKVNNAKAAGATAVIVFNEGQPGRDGVVAGTLGEPVTIPAVGTSYALGAELVGMYRNTRAPAAHIRTRFLWVGAEEEGLLGSHYYVDQPTDAQKLKIIAMLDFDMVASPNYARQVYDGNGSEEGNPAGPGGSGFIESLFTDWFDSQSQAHEPIPFDGRSDYVGFTDAGIPAGGIFTGAEKVKTQEEFEMFGGTVGAPLDPCYHQACDTTNNLNLKAFGKMKDAAADVLTQLSMIQGPIRDGRPVEAKQLPVAIRGARTPGWPPTSPSAKLARSRRRPASRNGGCRASARSCSSATSAWT